MSMTIDVSTRFLRVAIIGGGPGGLGAAIALSKIPHVEVNIYEQASELREIGAGISIGANSWSALIMEVKFEMQPPDDEIFEFNLDFILQSTKFSGRILCTTVFKTWTVDFGCDRSQANSDGLNDYSPLNQMSVYQVQPLLPVHNPAVRRWEVQIILDSFILEVFLNYGVRTGTTRLSSELLIDAIGFQTSKMSTWVNLSVVVQILRPEGSASRHH